MHVRAQRNVRRRNANREIVFQDRLTRCNRPRGDLVAQRQGRRQSDRLTGDPQRLTRIQRGGDHQHIVRLSQPDQARIRVHRHPLSAEFEAEAARPQAMRDVRSVGAVTRSQTSE